MVCVSKEEDRIKRRLDYLKDKIELLENLELNDMWYEFGNENYNFSHMKNELLSYQKNELEEIYRSLEEEIERQK